MTPFDHSTEEGSVWSCPDCPWEQRAHSVYGWAAHDDRAVEVHQTILCPARVVQPGKDRIG